MIDVNVPGFGPVVLEHLVLDFNGTLAQDGRLLPGVGAALRSLAGRVGLHVVTADTYGGCARALSGLPVVVRVLEPGPEDQGKLALVQALGADRCAAVGNGRNDALMLGAARLGIAVVQGECASVAALRNADLVAPDILSALDLLITPQRIVAGLRT